MIYLFNCGRYVQSPNRKWGYYECTKFADNFEWIKAFFPVRGVKHKDYLDWIEIGEMINKKEHLTKQGVTKIMQIKSNMNAKRLFDNKD
uniref:LAGLIDADG endonuclease n=1 Tax=Ophiocordycipitaceae sp. TaxID=1907519 RepID=A0A6M8PQF9_9HYPO|nr:LAGLIDADG endonuclease [Ophiocordycipitaceae sp.]QKG63782.1 LAGLIDADG endonuclease [Ophiocordycipitaceae sp.]